MQKENWSRVEELFHRYVDASEKEREVALAELKTTEPKTYDLLISLMEADDSPNQLFSESAESLLVKWNNDPDLVGSRIGAFELESIVGQGAMGSVFRARRIDGQFDQVVAIKLLQSQLIQSTQRSLFERERQILAKLNHPGIARLYDGGFTDEGRPYFTMEWISGCSLTEYDRQHSLRLTSKLHLFTQVCEAVKYAHQSLIAHLDLKPGNIIVDDQGVVKLLDFGVSRLIEESQDEGGSFTLAYAAPEQITRENATTVSDVYALGVILFELLVGKHPYGEYFDRPAILKEQILAGDHATFHLSKLPAFGNDLEKICAKAMSADPEKRYSSVDEMLADIKAFMNDYPISVRSRDWQYVGGKYFRRHRKVVTAIAVGIAVLIGTGTYYTVQLQEQRNIAQNEATKATRITELLTDVFMAADPNIGGADTITAVNLLHMGSENLKGNLADDEQLYVDMQLRLVPIFFNLGQYEEGKALAEESLQILSKKSDNPEWLVALSELQVGASFYYYGELDSAEKYTAMAIKRYEANNIKSDNYLGSLTQLANVYNDLGRIVEADSMYQITLKEYTAVRELPDIEVAFSLHMLGSTNRDLGNFEEAEDYFQKSLAMKRQLYEEPHLEIAYTYNYLGSLNQSTGNYEEALKYITASLEQREAILGNYHVEVVASIANTGRTYNLMGRYEDAIIVYERALDIIDSLFGKTHYYYAGIIGNQANSYLELGQYDKAREGILEAQRLYAELNPNNKLRQIPPIIRLGDISMREGEPEIAREYYVEALELRKEALPEGHYQIAQSQQTLGKCLIDLGDYPTAIEYLELALATYEADDETTDKTIASVNESLATAYEGMNDKEKASYYREQVAVAE